MHAVSENLDLRPVADSDALDQVPVIDIAPLINAGSGMVHQGIVTAIASACRDWGFFQVVNHGIDPLLIDQTWALTREFFALPLAQKEKILRSRQNPWGYYNNELTKNQRDRKEVFDFTGPGVDPIYSSENRWPDQITEFRDNLLAYHDACSRLSFYLLDIFCAGLDLHPGHLNGAFIDHTSFVRLNHYPVDDPLTDSTIEHLAEADMGVHHHTDAGALTLLLQDEVGGLQVHKDGYWHNVKPLPGAIVVNTGDMMQVWSNDRYQAAIHRVMAMHTADRYSIPYFFNPGPGARISPLVSGDEKARYRPILWSEFRGQRTDGDYADYGAEVQIAQFKINDNSAG